MLATRKELNRHTRFSAQSVACVIRRLPPHRLIGSIPVWAFVGSRRAPPGIPSPDWLWRAYTRGSQTRLPSREAG